jgi:glucose-6-phosphate isomerase
LEIHDYINTIAKHATEPVLERRLSDIADLYEAGKSTIEATGDRILYRFWTVEPAKDMDGELAFGMAEILPGTVGGQYHMTAGHFHVGSGAEVYIGVEGEGLLLIESRGGELKVCKFAKDSVVYIPSGWAHRAINTGTEKLRFVAIWPTGVGHDYKTIQERGFGCTVMATSEGPVVRKRRA